jgi:hypothetical protein
VIPETLPGTLVAPSTTMKGDGAVVKAWLPHGVSEQPNGDLSARLAHLWSRSVEVGVCGVVKVAAVDSSLLKLPGQASVHGAVSGER